MKKLQFVGKGEMCLTSKVIKNI